MNATNYSSNSMNAACLVLTADEYATVDYVFSVLSIFANLLTCPLASYSSERTLRNRDENKKKTSQHAQHTVGLYGRNRSGSGDRLSAGFHCTRDFPSGWWIIICILRGLYHTKDDNKLPLPSISSSFGPYRRGTFCCDHMFTPIRQHRDQIPFNCSSCMLLGYYDF